MYHHVASSVAPGPYARALTLDPAEFAGQLQLLRARGCETVTVDTIVADVLAGAVRGCEVALTFDDGYADDASVVEPLLDAAADTATMYISSGFVGTPGHLSRAQVRSLALDGIQLGAHTVNHVDLTALSRAQAQREILDSRIALETAGGATVDSFAYPAGQYNAGVEALVKAAGFRNALTTQPGSLLAPGAIADLFALPRYRIEHNTGSALMAQVVGSHLPRGRTADELRGIARRRIEGNDAPLAERIGAALLNASYPEQLLKVRVLRAGDTTVVGLMLSGVKFHGDVSRARFEADVGGMVDRTFDARPDIAEVDVWAIAPLAVAPEGAVSGDYAAPTTRTVFSAAVTRRARETAASRVQMLGTMYWEKNFLTKAATQ